MFMMYEEEIKDVILDTLNDRVSSISFTIGKLLEEGFSPNNKKKCLLSWLTILIHAYTNIDSLTEEQQKKLDELYNNVIRL